MNEIHLGIGDHTELFRGLIRNTLGQWFAVDFNGARIDVTEAVAMLMSSTLRDEVSEAQEPRPHG